MSRALKYHAHKASIEDLCVRKILFVSARAAKQMFIYWLSLNPGIYRCGFNGIRRNKIYFGSLYLPKKYLYVQRAVNIPIKAPKTTSLG